MSEIPSPPPLAEEWKINAAQEFRLEQARLLAEENESKIWRLPFEGALYWAKKRNVPAAVWLHGYIVRYRSLWICFELLSWGAVLTSLFALIRRISLR